MATGGMIAGRYVGGKVISVVWAFGPTVKTTSMASGTAAMEVKLAANCEVVLRG